MDVSEMIRTVGYLMECLKINHSLKEVYEIDNIKYKSASYYFGGSL